VSWTTSTDPYQLVIEGPPGATATVRYRVMLGNLDHVWTDGPGYINPASGNEIPGRVYRYDEPLRAP
jgi:hypothetical protein